MPARRRGPIRLKAPYLRRVWLDPARMPADRDYPFSLPWLGDLDIAFDRAITVIVGENGTGKSTLLEAIATLAGYDRAGGGKGYRPADHSLALAVDGGDLAFALRASWLPRITDGWFFRAESFYTVARYLDDAAREPFSGPPPDYLSHSHGEGFLRFFTERCRRQGLFIFDEPESALSPARQVDFLRLLRRMEESGVVQVVIATHAPILMAYPGAALLGLTADGLAPIALEDTAHYRLTREFILDPEAFVAERLDGHADPEDLAKP